MVHDVLFFGCILVGAIGGAWKGLALQLAGLGSLILGLLIGGPASKAIVAGMSSPPPGRRLLVFLGCYAAVALACYLAAAVFRKKLEDKKLERWDKHVGGLVGLVHGLFVATVLAFFALVIAPEQRKPFLDRASGQVCKHAFIAIHATLPSEAQEGIEPLIDRVKSD